MKKFILLLCLFTLKSLIAQNGFTSFTATIPSGSGPGYERAFLIDNSGDKWVGFSNGSNTSAAMIARYNTISGTWTYFNKTNTPSLLSGSVLSLCKDNLGNIWIGTNVGLMKYDGINFTTFTTINGLPNNFINSLDYINNMLYIGTSNGLSRFDGTTFTNYNTANTLLPYNAITSIKAENSNTIWLGTVGYLVKFYINATYTSTSYTTIPATNTLSIWNIYIDGTGDKWLGTSNGIFKYNNSSIIRWDSLYPVFTGANISYFSSNFNMTKGPNNGVMFCASYSGFYSGNCLVELLSGGNYHLFYAPITGSITPGNFCFNDGSGKIFISKYGSVTSATTTPIMYSFNSAAYNGFGLGPSGGVNNNNFKFLDINRVKAGIMNRGDMWWDAGGGGNASYEVPKVNYPATGVHGGFAASLWLGGLDASNQLHTAAQTYRQAGSDFWPGPLDTLNATTDTATFINYDKIWKVSYIDINNFIINFNNGNIAANTYTPTTDILTWPAKGTGTHSRNLAPFVDVNNNGIYDPLVGGDYPKIKGDETLYYIFNDNFTTHSETGGLPFGVEVHAMAYAYGCNGILNGRNELAYTTFYDYKIYNRSNNNYHRMYVGFWTDGDLGCYLDDYIGSSQFDHLGFIYNSTGSDNPSCGGTNAYGNYPPAAGTTVLKSPLATADGVDNDYDGLTDEPGEELGMSYFDYYNNNIGMFPTASTNPSNKYHYYNYLHGQWKDSTYFTYGGNAYGPGTPTQFVYPGSLCPQAGWNEYSAGNLAGDRRYIVSSGPFDLNAKQSTEVEYAYVWSVDSLVINSNLGSACKLISDVQKIRGFYTSNPSNCLLSINVGINENNLSSQFSVYPNPANSAIYIYSEPFLNSKASVKIVDVLGKTVLQKQTDDLNHSVVNINELSSGVYFINVIFDNNKSIVKKFVKQ